MKKTIEQQALESHLKKMKLELEQHGFKFYNKCFAIKLFENSDRSIAIHLGTYEYEENEFDSIVYLVENHEIRFVKHVPSGDEEIILYGDDNNLIKVAKHIN